LACCFLSCTEQSGRTAPGAALALAETGANPERHTTSSPENAVWIGDGSLRLSAAFETPYVLQGGDQEELYLLIDVDADSLEDVAQRAPMNISLVIDKSGSMQGEKLARAKEAASQLVGRLGSNDKISVVTYDSYVYTQVSSTPVIDRSAIQSVINYIGAGSSTNLGAGMQEGFVQARSSRQTETINRILLLSDGLANQGVTNPVELYAMANNAFTEEGLGVSTFGIGEDFNEELMTGLSEHGRGNYHFIANSEQIPAMISKEIDGLLSVVARNAQIRVKLPDGVHVEQVYGYNHRLDRDDLIIDYSDMFSAEERKVLVKLKLEKPIESVSEFSVSMIYDDQISGKDDVEHSITLKVSPTADGELYTSSINKRVGRRRVTFVANENFEDAMRAVDQGHYEDAERIIILNDSYMRSQSLEVGMDSILDKQMRGNGSYGEKLEDIKQMNERERKSFQKSEKSTNYKLRKNKKDYR
jgi:Ca-activated chloride channel family protein